jgi:ketosteroid isomerase-like protein
MATGIQGAGEKKGRKAIIDEFLGPVRGIFVDGDPKVLIQHLILQGPYAAVEAKGLGKFKNGKDYNNRYAFMIEIKDDKVFALREYMDSYYVSTL